jgi:hypothetical protein
VRDQVRGRARLAAAGNSRRGVLAHMSVPSFRRDYTTAVKDASRRTDTLFVRRSGRGQESVRSTECAVPRRTHRANAFGSQCGLA